MERDFVLNILISVTIIAGYFFHIIKKILGGSLSVEDI